MAKRDGAPALPTQGDFMARETSFFVQSFIAGRGGNLKADAPIA